MNFTFEILNAAYLPNSEAFPDFGSITIQYDPSRFEDAGVENIHNSSYIQLDECEEVKTTFLANDLVDMFEEGIRDAGGTETFSTDLLTSTDANLYRWLKQAESYCRLGLDEADEANPMLEVFIYNH